MGHIGKCEKKIRKSIRFGYVKRESSGDDGSDNDMWRLHSNGAKGKKNFTDNQSLNSQTIQDILKGWLVVCL